MTIRHFGPGARPTRADTPHVDVPLRNARPGDLLPTGERIDRLVYARSGHTRVYYTDSTGYERSKVLPDFTGLTRPGPRVHSVTGPRRLRRGTGTECGFTLMELLIFGTVLGIFAVIVTFAVGPTKSGARHSACAALRRSVEQSAEAVKVRTRAYPVGTLDASSSPNPLVAPAPGALLDEWPSSPDYSLHYSSTDSTAYTVDVIDRNGNPVGCQSL